VGIAGFGHTEEEAMNDFRQKWSSATPEEREAALASLVHERSVKKMAIKKKNKKGRDPEKIERMYSDPGFDNYRSALTDGHIGTCVFKNALENAHPNIMLDVVSIMPPGSTRYKQIMKAVERRKETANDGDDGVDPAHEVAATEAYEAQIQAYRMENGLSRFI
jgi:hypothetical protein